LPKVILVTDSDEAGEALREELARRIGRAKCYSVTYPEDCKDANDVLKKYGEDAVKALVQGAEPMPLEGVYTVDDYKVDVKHLYSNGMMGGLSTGMPRSMSCSPSSRVSYRLSPGFPALVSQSSLIN
jgi:twinkle protein